MISYLRAICSTYSYVVNVTMICPSWKGYATPEPSPITFFLDSFFFFFGTLAWKHDRYWFGHVTITFVTNHRKTSEVGVPEKKHQLTFSVCKVVKSTQASSLSYSDCFLNGLEMILKLHWRFNKLECAAKTAHSLCAYNTTYSNVCFCA